MSSFLDVGASQGVTANTVIFVHGINGDEYATWCYGHWPRHIRPNPYFWPSWVLEDQGGIRVLSAAYPSAADRWHGEAMHIADRGRNLLELILAKPEAQAGGLTLIGYSMGGLVIKQMIRTAADDAILEPRKADFLRRVHKVAFLATPHLGSSIATVGDRLRILARPTLAAVSLVKNSPELQALNIWYRNWALTNPVGHLVLMEGRPMPLYGYAVNPDSGDPGIAGAAASKVDADHVSITKPPSREGEVYVKVLDFLSRAPPQRPMIGVAANTPSHVAYASDEQLDLVRKGRQIPIDAVRDQLVSYGMREDVDDSQVPALIETFVSDFPELTNNLRTEIAVLPEAARLSAERMIAEGNLSGAGALLTRMQLSSTEVSGDFVRDRASAIGSQGLGLIRVGRSKRNEAMQGRGTQLVRTAIELLIDHGFRDDAEVLRKSVPPPAQ